MNTKALETQEQRDKDDCTVAVCRCGRAVVVAVTEHMSLAAQHACDEAAANGYEMMRLTAKDARKLPFGCKCEKL